MLAHEYSSQMSTQIKTLKSYDGMTARTCNDFFDLDLTSCQWGVDNKQGVKKGVCLGERLVY